MRRTLASRATGAFALAAGLAMLTACGSAPQATADTSTIVPQGEQLRVALSSVDELKSVGGTITTRDTADARARIPGVLVSLRVRAGDAVRKGQQIGFVSDQQLGFQANAYGAQAAAASAQADAAQAELTRTEFLYRNGVYAKARLDQAQAQARAARAQISAAASQQSATRSVAAQGAIIAPASGRVLRADIPAGSAVAPGISVATITAGPPVVRLTLPDALAGRVHNGARVTVDAGTATPLVGTVVQVYPAVMGGQMTADVSVPTLDTTLIGRQVTAQLALGSRQALVIPKRFIQTRFGVDQVTIISGKQALTVPVQTAPTANPTQVEILSGVAAGDVLVAPKAIAQ
jgi:RND family efflux transporter MFP subunit